MSASFIQNPARRTMTPLTVCLLICASTVLGGGDKDRSAIAKVLDDQAIAWNKGDLIGFMAGYEKSEDLSFFSGNNKTKGWEATLDRYKKKYQGEGKEMGKLAFTELSIELLGPDHALVRGRYRLEFRNETPTGIFSLIMRRTAAGWKVIHDHTSS